MRIHSRTIDIQRRVFFKNIQRPRRNIDSSFMQCAYVTAISLPENFSFYKSIYKVQHVTDGAPSHYILHTNFAQETKQKSMSVPLFFLSEYAREHLILVVCAY